MSAPLPTLDGVLADYGPLIRFGLALRWLRPRSKISLYDGDITMPRHDEAELRARHVEGANVGVRLGLPSSTPAGYLQAIDLDIRKPEAADEAWAALDRLCPGARAFPRVVSGSGGASRHIYFLSPEPLRKKKIARSEGSEKVWDRAKEREVTKRDWEIEVVGGGAHVVLPPSIHPDTGLPYRWEVPFDPIALELGLGPTFAPGVIAGWGVEATREEGDEDDLAALVAQEPLDVDMGEVARVMRDLPPDWIDDRDQWLMVGAALHHQFRGADEGFAVWCEWASASDKFDEKDSRRVWRSFKGSKRPVRFATLIAAAGRHRLGTDLAVVEAPEVPDLLGEIDGSGASFDFDILAPAAAPPKPAAAGDWLSLVQFSEDGQVKSTLPNLQLVIENDVRTRGVLGFNEFTCEVVLRRSPGRFNQSPDRPKPARQLDGRLWDVPDPLNGEIWTDSHDNALRLVLESPTSQGGYGIRVADRDLRGAVDAVARRAPFHPLRDHLDALRWDGVPRVERLFIDYLGAPDTPYHREVARLTLLGAVARIYRPGCKFDYVPILEGAQGKGKSTFIKILGLNWSTELVGDFGDSKAMVEQMQGSWIMEIPELQGFGRIEANVLKAFISKGSDKARLSYERRARPFPRQCIFIGSTNDDEYLRDMTGGRRFWPVPCHVEGPIDTDRFRREVNLYWAEAVALYKGLAERLPAGEPMPIYLANDAVRQEAEQHQAQRRVADAEEGLAGAIEAWLEEPIGGEFESLDGAPPLYREETCAMEVWVEMLGESRARFDRAQTLRVYGALKRLEGWEMAGLKRTKNYGPQRVYRRVEAKE